MYMVVFTSAEGKSGYHQVEDLDEALRFVEHMRNGEGVTNARLFRMTEIPIEVKAYYKVEVAATAPIAVPPPSSEATLAPVASSSF